MSPVAAGRRKAFQGAPGVHYHLSCNASWPRRKPEKELWWATPPVLTVAGGLKNVSSVWRRGVASRRHARGQSWCDIRSLYRTRRRTARSTFSLAQRITDRFARQQGVDHAPDTSCPFDPATGGDAGWWWNRRAKVEAIVEGPSPLSGFRKHGLRVCDKIPPLYVMNAPKPSAIPKSDVVRGRAWPPLSYLVKVSLSLLNDVDPTDAPTIQIARPSRRPTPAQSAALSGRQF